MNLFTSDLFVNDQWVDGPNITHITERETKFGCGVHLKGHNISVIIYDYPEIYNWTSGDWTSADNREMLWSVTGG